MEASQPESEPPRIDARTRSRIVSVALNEATAELYKARHEVLYRRLRLIPARRHMPAWAAALIVGSVGAALGAIPAMLVRGDNVLFVFLAVCAAYTILSPATLLLLADRDEEDDSNRLVSREEALHRAVEERNGLRDKVADLHEQHRRARDSIGEAKSESGPEQTIDPHQAD